MISAIVQQDLRVKIIQCLKKWGLDIIENKPNNNRDDLFVKSLLGIKYANCSFFNNYPFNQNITVETLKIWP